MYQIFGRRPRDTMMAPPSVAGTIHSIVAGQNYQDARKLSAVRHSCHNRSHCHSRDHSTNLSRHHSGGQMRQLRVQLLLLYSVRRSTCRRAPLRGTAPLHRILQWDIERIKAGT